MNELHQRNFKTHLTHPIKNVKKHALKSSQGSGFFINNNGLIITNQHVIEGFETVNISTHTHNNFGAKVLYENKEEDIAILSPLQQFTINHWLSIHNNDPKIGEKISVIGYPLSQVLGNSVKITQGIVSAQSGIKGNAQQFQISAAVQPGNSGGPIINTEFKVLGIATSRLSDSYFFKYLNIIPQNINFGVKSTTLLSVLKTHGIKSLQASKITRLEEALKATVLINTASPKHTHSLPSDFKIEYEYTYYWEFDSISYLSIKLFNKSNVLLSHVKYSGDSLSSPASIARQMFVLLLK